LLTNFIVQFFGPSGMYVCMLVFLLVILMKIPVFDVFRLRVPAAAATDRNGFAVSQWRDDIMSTIPASRSSVRLRIRAGRTRTRSIQRCEYRILSASLIMDMLWISKKLFIFCFVYLSIFLTYTTLWANVRCRLIASLICAILLLINGK